MDTWVFNLYFTCITMWQSHLFTIITLFSTPASNILTYILYMSLTTVLYTLQHCDHIHSLKQQLLMSPASIILKTSYTHAFFFQRVKTSLANLHIISSCSYHFWVCGESTWNLLSANFMFNTGILTIAIMLHIRSLDLLILHHCNRMVSVSTPSFRDAGNILSNKNLYFPFL